MNTTPASGADAHPDPQPGAEWLRATVLSDPSRHRVWAAVREAEQPVGVEQLARDLRLHPNTVRLHLGRLTQAGLVANEPEPDRHPGRPGRRYRSVGADPTTEAAAYRRLASLLAAAVRSRTSARQAGRTVAAREAAGLPGTDPLQTLKASLGAQGFAPRVQMGNSGQIDIVLQACPFAAAAAQDPATICQLHLGLAEGAAEALGGLEVKGLEVKDPFRAGCRLRLRAVPEERVGGGPRLG